MYSAVVLLVNMYTCRGGGGLGLNYTCKCCNSHALFSLIEMDKTTQCGVSMAFRVAAQFFQV